MVREQSAAWPISDTPIILKIDIWGIKITVYFYKSLETGGLKRFHRIHSRIKPVMGSAFS